MNDNREEGEQKERVELYQKAITQMIIKSGDIDYLMAVYSFAVTYPDNSRGAGW